MEIKGTSGMRVRRRDKRAWLMLLGVFFMIFLFTFLKGHFKDIDFDAEAASLADFDPGYIISDYQMGNYNSMTEAEIQAFLTKKNPCNNTDYELYQRMITRYPSLKWNFKNGHFVCISEELFGDGEVIGSGETAAHIIWKAAQDYKINPQVLIVLLQKEQGLITDDYPNSLQYRSATGYGCPDTAACSSKYYGFKNQVRNAAAMFRTVLNGGWTNYPLGENYIQYNPNPDCGGSVVNVKNLATSSLYRYTPYQPNADALAVGYGTTYCGAYGNRNFYLYFQDWFGGITVTKEVSAPRNLAATQSGSNITITWDEPSDIDLYGNITYEIVLANNKGVEQKATVSKGIKKYTFSNLANGEYIAASVKAIAVGTGSHDRITFDFAIGTKPSAPTSLKAEAKNGGIEISWVAPDDTGGLDISKYEIVLADVDKNEFKQEVSGDADSTIFYGLKMNEYFAASVKAFNAKGSQHTRITFSIKNYMEFLDDFEIYEGFRDMPTDETGKTAVSWAVSNGITDKNTYFNGGATLTRRQAMVLFWRIAGQPETEAYSGFLDMPTDEISKNAVSWAAYNGITDKNSYFSSGAALTRRQAMVLFWRMAGQPETEIYDGFLDMPTDEIGKKAVSWAVSNGITDKNTYFNGGSALTRRQAMIVMMRFYESIIK